VELDTVCVGVAHLGNLLALAHGLVFLDQQRLVVGIGREEGVVVLQDHQVAIAAQACAGVDHAAIGSSQHGLARLAGNIEALVARLVKARDQRARSGPDEGDVVLPSRRGS